MTEEQNELRAMIRRQLRRRRPPDTKALYGRAVRIDPEVRKLDLRQFNATHVLPVRKELKREEGPSPEEEERVRALVKRRLLEDPGLSTERLQEEAAEIAPSVTALDRRQFHARYALPVKRRLPDRESASDENDQTEEPSGQAGSEGSTRQDLRSMFLEFAGALEGAADRSEVVRVVGSVDSYVDQVLSALGPSAAPE